MGACSCIVIHGHSGQIRANNSWILGRLMRDYPTWMSKEVRRRTQAAIAQSTQVPKPPSVSLCVGVYQPVARPKRGKPIWDKVAVSGLMFVILQLVLSAMPFFWAKNWLPFAITLIGTLLAWLPLAILPWTDEKWTCRKGPTAPFIITKGNGHQHAIVILGSSLGLHLEDLATSQRPVSGTVKLQVLGLATLWVLFLVASRSVGSSSSALWLLAVGAVGMLQNILVAAWPRESGV